MQLIRLALQALCFGIDPIRIHFFPLTVFDFKLRSRFYAVCGGVRY